MSPRALRRLFFWTALFVLPLPILALGPGLVPPRTSSSSASLALVFGALESAQGIALALAGTLPRPRARSMRARSGSWPGPSPRGCSRSSRPLTRTRAALLLVLLGVAIAVAEPIYVTPFSSRSARSTLLGVYR